jgi:hypothetical protein
VEDAFDRRQIGICLVVQQRLQDRSPCRAFDSMQRRPVQVRCEDDVLVRFAVLLDVREEFRRADIFLDERSRGSFGDRKNADQLATLVQVEEFAVGAVKRHGVACDDRESPHGDA